VFRVLAVATAVALAAPGGAAAGEPPVYALDPRVDVPVAAVSAAIVALPPLLDSRIVRERCPCDRGDVNAVDRRVIGNRSVAASTASDVSLALAVAAPPLLGLARLGIGEAWITDTAVFAETLLVNGAIVQVTKYAVQRPRPRTYAGEQRWVEDADGYQSFYSGHVSTVFAALAAAAYTARLRDGERGWPWLVALAGGGSVAAERVVAGQHFPTDVLVGAAMGLAVGVAVPALHARGGPRLVPAAAGTGFALRWGG
jgi:membrane-associated phospholipid phosphatase